MSAKKSTKIEVHETEGDETIAQFRQKTDAAIARLEEGREALISPLRELHQRARPNVPFEEDRVWQSIALAARLVLARLHAQKTSVGPTSEAQLYRKIAASLETTRHLIQNSPASTALGPDMAHTWWDAVGKHGGPERQWVWIEDEFKTWLDGFADFAAEMRKGADEMTRPKNRPRGTSATISAREVAELASLYENATGAEAGAGSGGSLFFNFVHSFLTHLDYPMYGHLNEAIKYGLRQRKKSASAPPSPEDAH
ncbi:MAG TPA: hypothetical protein VMU06_01355 [Stellaceae bacterium]|nr:hypothetical protein [Stellaceae bacterium]